MAWGMFSTRFLLTLTCLSRALIPWIITFSWIIRRSSLGRTLHFLLCPDFKVLTLIKCNNVPVPTNSARTGCGQEHVVTCGTSTTCPVQITIQLSPVPRTLNNNWIQWIRHGYTETLQVPGCLEVAAPCTQSQTHDRSNYHRRECVWTDCISSLDAVQCTTVQHTRFNTLKQSTQQYCIVSTLK